MKLRLFVSMIFVFSMALTAVVRSEAQVAPTRTISNIGEDLYWVQSNVHYTVFLVTDQGIILADPINHSFAEWLKGQLEERFNVPVRYVLYSHNHPDHASGGSVFEDTAQFVGHENMIRNLAERDPPPLRCRESSGFSTRASRFGCASTVPAGGRR